jgi:hypothetical protein
MSSRVMSRDKVINVIQTNMFGCNGKLVSMPRFLIYYKDSTICYGDFSINDYSQMIEWLSMQHEGIPFGEVKNYCKQHNPKMIVELNSSRSYIEISYNDDFNILLSTIKEFKESNLYLFTRSLIKPDSSIYHKKFKYGYVRGFINENNEYVCDFQGVMENINASELEVING